MNIGDYVRTPNGVIAKIIDIQDEVGQYYLNNNAVSLKSKTYIADKNITIGESFKHSSNIIDLIEVGDYVNGKKVVDKQYHYTDKDNYDMGEWCIFYENVALGDYQYDIKSIVTKEQFESMEYKVGDKE